MFTSVSQRPANGSIISTGVSITVLVQLVKLGDQLPFDGDMSANPDLIALRSGRPVIVVPDGFSEVRAIHDAMPALGARAKVTILTVGSTEVPGTQTLLRSLPRHGIDAELVLKTRRNTISGTILSTAREFSAKRVVMGAFEHSKYSHDLFGGVTTDVMPDFDVPVFLSH
jgi:nucleotide-binding universal stress UspA family protein